MDEVVLASRGLQEVSRTIKDLVEFAQANHRTTMSRNDTQATAVKTACTCVICAGMLYHYIYMTVIFIYTVVKRRHLQMVKAWFSKKNIIAVI